MEAIDNGLVPGLQFGIDKGLAKGLHADTHRERIGKELFYSSLFNDPSLQGYWRMEGNSKDWRRTNHGTDTDILYAPEYGKFGLGPRFNGTTSKIVVSNGASSPFRQSSAITYCFWANIPAGGIGWMGVAASGGHYSGGIAIQNNFRTFSWTPTTPFSDRAWSTPAITLTAGGTWNFYAFSCSFSGASSGKWYVNGLPITTTISTADVSNGTPRTTGNTTNGDCIGARFINSFFYGNALFDDVAVFSRVLNPAEISTHFLFQKS